MLMNVVPVRLALRPEVPAATAVRALHRRLAEIRRYETTSLAEIRRWCGLAAEHDLFDTVLVFENYPVPLSLTEPAPGLVLESVETLEHSDRAVVVTVAPGAALRLGLTYSGTRVGAMTARRLLDAFAALLAALPAAVAAGVPLGAADIAPDAAAVQIDAFMETL